MKKLHYILTFVSAILIYDNCFSQQVIATAGGSGSGTGIELSWTIGETITTTASGSNVILTQGFHQSWPFIITENQNIALNAGWNIFSSYVIPSDPDMKNIFNPLITSNSLIKIQDENGNSLENWGIFGGWKNKIGNIESTEGYKARFTTDCQLTISGSKVLLPLSIPLKTGWNIISYPHLLDYNAMSVIQPLIDNNSLIKMQDEKGNSIEDWVIFGGWKNSIGNCIAGEGYKIKVRNDVNLVINSNYPKSSGFITVQAQTGEHFRLPEYGNGVDHMNFYLADVEAGVIEPKDEIGIFEGNSCIGSIKIPEDWLPGQMLFKAVTASHSVGDIGFHEGSPYELRLFKSAESKEYILNPLILRGSSLFSVNESVFLGLNKSSVTGNSIHSYLPATVINCFPNPFSNELQIELFLPESSRLDVDVISIEGRIVKKLVDYELFSEGNHKLLWKVNNDNLTDGIYFIHFITKYGHFYKKLIYKT